MLYRFLLVNVFSETPTFSCFLLKHPIYNTIPEEFMTCNVFSLDLTLFIGINKNIYFCNTYFSNYNLLFFYLEINKWMLSSKFSNIGV